VDSVSPHPTKLKKKAKQRTSNKQAASRVFLAVNQAQQEASMKQRSTCCLLDADFFFSLLFDPEDRGGVFL
jgi:hypothetical protein